MRNNDNSKAELLLHIGETICLSQRLPAHNSDNGAQGTEDIRDLPWAVAGYICGLCHMKPSDRMSLT